MKEFTNKKLKKTVTFLTAAIFWLAVWWVAAFFTDKQVVLPSPYDVFCSLIHLAATSGFWLSVCMSILRVLAGFTAGAICGVLLAFVSHFVNAVRVLLTPVIYVVRATPVVSFIIIAIVWFTVGIIPTLASAIIVFPIVYDTVLTALDGTNKGLLEVAAVFSWSRIKKLRLLYFPSVRRQMFSSFMTSFGLAWKAGIAAEVLCTPKASIGKHLYDAKIYLESSDMLAWTAVVIIISIILEKSVIKRGVRYANQRPQ